MPPPSTPREIYGALFEAVQSRRVFPDSKTFVDAVARRAPAEIIASWSEQRVRPGFDLERFVRAEFDLPGAHTTSAGLPVAEDVRTQIEQLWPRLTRPADPVMPYASLIALPHPYVVPGGRFRELYYWDSYFTMLGLAASGHVKLLEDMVDNFASLIDRIGFIPNGTRTYYGTRSQPPFFVLMVELLASVKGGPEVLDRYAPQLEQEYAFWMAGGTELAGDGAAVRRVVRLDGVLLNRYWDDSAEPREESYAEDVELAASTPRAPASLYRDLRAACESGWDFSSRWFGESQAFGSIRTTEVLPVDLNCLLHRMEQVLGGIMARAGDLEAAQRFRAHADARQRMIQSLFHDDEAGFFFDVDIGERRSTGKLSLAAAWPLFCGIATGEQATRVASRLEQEFLRPGGWVTTPYRTGQQWDAPNGWAPLQWIVHEGLRRYGYDDLAREGARRWIETVTNAYRASGHFMEKYDVEDSARQAGGGEYAVQDGFGWTNGVLLGLLERVPR